jgi:GT2 family glycosyltransferase
MTHELNRPQRPHEFIDRDTYHRWIEKFQRLDASDRDAIARCLQHEGPWPIISVAMPVFDTPRQFLVEAIESVRDQAYPFWELCIADDASQQDHVCEVLQSYRKRDARIKITRLSENGNISAASNQAINLADGEFVAMMDHDDVLAPHALFMVARETILFPQADLIYSDSDQLDTSGQRCNPYFKPDWNYDLLLSQNYINHLAVFRRRKLQQIGGFRTGFEGSQDYDLLLRFSERIDPAIAVRHIPHVLYHWRIVPSSFSRTKLAQANRRARVAIEQHLTRCGQPGRSLPARRARVFHHVQRVLPDPLPTISVVPMIESTAHQGAHWLKSVRERTRYPRIDFLTARLGKTWALHCPARSGGVGSFWRRFVSRSGGPAARLMRAIQRSKADVLVFLDEGILPTAHDWLDELVGQVLREDMGMVAASVLGENPYAGGSRREKAEVDPKSGDGLLHENMPSDHSEGGYFARLALDHQVSSLTGGCVAVRRKTLRKVGGFDRRLQTPRAQFLDLSLKVSALGLGLLRSAHVEVQYVAPREPKALTAWELGYLWSKWHSVVPNAFPENPNLKGRAGIYQLDFPPRCTLPWRDSQAAKAA